MEVRLFATKKKKEREKFISVFIIFLGAIFAHCHLLLYLQIEHELAAHSRGTVFAEGKDAFPTTDFLQSDEVSRHVVLHSVATWYPDLFFHSFFNG
jgi:hypothetical protein